MKDKYTSRKNEKQTSHIPELEIIDLEEGETPSVPDGPDSRDNRRRARDLTKKPFRLHISIHVVLLAVTLLFVAGIVYKFMNFGVPVDLDEIFKDGPGTYDDTFDTILPLIDQDGNPVYAEYGEGSNILLFGNAPFADDRDSKDGLANMIREETGANVINCSISGSYLATELTELNAQECPWDIFNFYWLCTIAIHRNPGIPEQFLAGMEILGDSAPPEAMEVFNTLQEIDLDTIDVIVVMYDASDYLAGHEMYNDADSTDLTQFTGNTEAGIELLRFHYPNIRLIILSPTYAYGLDENGNYVSSDIQRYGQDVLSTYVIKQYASCASRSVTFVDNLYGTITEDNAKEYLTDHLHLNQKGRKKVAERLLYALNYFKDGGDNSSAGD